MPAKRKKAGTPADLRKSKRRAILTPADPDDSRVASPGTVDAVPRPSVVEVPGEPVIPESEHLAPINVQHSEGYDDSTISLAMDIAQVLQNSRGNVARLRKGNSAPESSSMSNTAVASTNVPVASTSCPPTQADNLDGALEMLLGDNQDQCQSHPRQPLPNLSSSTPLGFSVLEKNEEKIWGNQFIDLGLLIANHQVADKFNISITNEQNSNPALSLVPNLRPEQYKNIEEWTSAFIVFVAIYSSHHPLEAPRLMKYMETVRDLSKIGGWAFKNYDENFRMMKQNDPSWPWDVMHSEYWMRATLTTGQNVNNSNNQSFREPQTLQPNSENLCFRFQRRGFCPFKQNCKFAHCCSSYGDSRHHHTAYASNSKQGWRISIREQGSQGER